MDITLIVPTHRYENPKLFELTIQTATQNSSGYLREIVIVGEVPTKVQSTKVPIHIIMPDISRVNIGSGYARNLGAKHAHGQVLVFTDSHCYFHEGWDSAIIEGIREFGNCVISLRSYPIELHEDEVIHRIENAGLGCALTEDLEVVWVSKGADLGKYIAVPGNVTHCLAVPKHVFKETLIGFLPGYFEDVELCFRLFRLGYDTLVTKDKYVGHYYKSENDPSWERTWKRNGTRLLFTVFNKVATTILDLDGERRRKALQKLEQQYGELYYRALQSAEKVILPARKILEQKYVRTDEEYFQIVKLCTT